MAGGVIALLLGLYGVVGPNVSVVLAAAGLLMFLSGFVVLIYGLKGTLRSLPHPYMLGVFALAAALHAYEQVGPTSSDFSAGWLLWALTPYLVCMAASCFPATHVPAVVGALVALAFDSLAHYEVFVNPKSSTAGLALLFVPLWNSIVFAPIGMLISWLIIRRRTTTETNAP